MDWNWNPEIHADDYEELQELLRLVAEMDAENAKRENPEG